MKRKRIEFPSKSGDLGSRSAEKFEQPLRGLQRGCVWSFEPAECRGNGFSPRVKIEDRAAEIDAFDFRQFEVIQRGLLLGRPEPQASTRRRPTGPPGTPGRPTPC